MRIHCRWNTSSGMSDPGATTRNFGYPLAGLGQGPRLYMDPLWKEVETTLLYIYQHAWSQSCRTTVVHLYSLRGCHSFASVDGFRKMANTIQRSLLSIDTKTCWRCRLFCSIHLKALCIIHDKYNRSEDSHWLTCSPGLPPPPLIMWPII